MNTKYVIRCLYEDGTFSYICVRSNDLFTTENIVEARRYDTELQAVSDIQTAISWQHRSFKDHTFELVKVYEK